MAERGPRGDALDAGHDVAVGVLQVAGDVLREEVAGERPAEVGRAVGAVDGDRSGVSVPVAT